jgi:hypothetical protein
MAQLKTGALSRRALTTLANGETGGGKDWSKSERWPIWEPQRVPDLVRSGDRVNSQGVNRASADWGWRDRVSWRKQNLNTGPQVSSDENLTLMGRCGREREKLTENEDLGRCSLWERKSSKRNSAVGETNSPDQTRPKTTDRKNQNFSDLEHHLGGTNSKGHNAKFKFSIEINTITIDPRRSPPSLPHLIIGIQV